MAVDFRMLETPDIGGAFNRGIQQGRAMRIQGQTDSALSALAADPMDESALQSLAAVDPDRAHQFGERNRETQTRSALADTYNPETGQIDLQAASGVYAGQGDIGAALNLQSTGAEAEEARRTAARGQAVELSQLIDGVTDQQSYEAAVRAAARLNHDVSSLPPDFESARPILAEYSQILQIAQADDPTALMQNVEFLISQGVPKEQALAAAVQNVSRPVTFNTPGGGAGILPPQIGGGNPDDLFGDLIPGGAGGNTGGNFPGQ